MALNNSNYARDAVYIHDRLLETLTGLKDHYFTLNATGRDVVTVDETGKYNSKTITVNYVIDGATVEDFKDNLEYLEHILNRRDADISFNDEYSLFMVGDIHNLGLKEKHATWGLGSYEIVCENPLKYSKTISEVTATKTTDGTQTFSINYTGRASTQPIIEVIPGAAVSSRNYPQDANLEFINVQNLNNQKSISIGSSYPDGTTERIANPNFKTVTLIDLNSAGWTDITYCNVATQSDPYYNKGTGLSYKALYPTNYDSGTHDEDDPKDTNATCYKTLSSNIYNFVCAYGVRMWAEELVSGGSLKLTARTTDGNETGVVIYKNSLDNLKGKVLYYVNGIVMGSDTIDLSKYSNSLGLTDRQNATVTRLSTGKIYFQDEVVNKKRPKSALVEQKVDGSYVYTQANNNIVFSKLGQTYTFKVADLPIRRFNYMRESGVDIGYNRIIIGFKTNMISSGYSNLTTQITGIDVLSVQNPSLLNNWGILTAGNTYQINPANLDLHRGMENSEIGIYAPEYVGLYNSENNLVINPESNNSFQCIYYNKTSGNDPGIKVKYNTIYI